MIEKGCASINSYHSLSWLVNLEDIFVKLKIDNILAEILLRFSHNFWESDLIPLVDFLVFFLEPTFFHSFLFTEMS